MAEHLTFNQRVRGSNPRWLTRRSPFLRVGILFFKTGREKRGFSLLFLTFRVGQREKKEGIPILAMTANAFAADRKKALEMGMNGHIAKPINGEKIQGALAPILMEKGAKG